jgi:hypothetical protein
MWWCLTFFWIQLGPQKKWLVVIQRGWDYSPHHSSKHDGIFVWYQTWLVVEPPTPLKNMTNCQLGWWNSLKFAYIYMESHKSHVPNHEPVKQVAKLTYGPDIKSAGSQDLHGPRRLPHGPKIRWLNRLIIWTTGIAGKIHWSHTHKKKFDVLMSKVISGTDSLEVPIPFL